nr:hypothetical protein [Prevotella sp.]
MSFDEHNMLGTWSYVVPSYTIFNDDNKTFSDIWSEYSPVFKEFYDHVVVDVNRYKDVKEIKAKENTNLSILTMDEEETIEVKDKKIRVIPVWKWMRE